MIEFIAELLLREWFKVKFMPLLTFTQLTPEEILLLENNKRVKEFLTPKEKFDSFCRNKKSRKFHFVCVENGSELVLFDGLGKELKIFKNDFKGQREARVFALDIFVNTPPEQAFGGHNFDFA